MPSLSLGLPAALAGRARTWVCLSCMFWMKFTYDEDDRPLLPF